MKAYGMTRLEAGDTDVAGCQENGRATSVYNLSGPGGKPRAYRCLRNGKKAATRRFHKRRARNEGKQQAREDQWK